MYEYWGMLERQQLPQRESERVLSLNSYLSTNSLRPVLLYKNTFYPAAIRGILDH